MLVVGQIKVSVIFTGHRFHPKKTDSPSVSGYGVLRQETAQYTAQSLQETAQIYNHVNLFIDVTLDVLSHYQ